MATPEEIERARAFYIEQTEKPKTRPTNPNAGQQEAAPPSDMAQLFQTMLEMMQQQQQNIPTAKDEGLLGGRGESSRNPGGRNNAGLDWLREGYNPDNNPFERKDIQGRARRDVSNAKLEQANQERMYRDGITRNGHGSKDIGGATLSSFYRDPQSEGPLPDPVMSVLNIPDQYGGGMGYGSQMPLPKADPSLLLPTGGYNAEAGIGGSGVPMSAGEAQSVGNLGNGIYAPRDASNPASQDAIMARQALAQGGINQRLKEFYTNPFQGPQRQAQQSTAPSPNVVQAQPGLPKSITASEDEIRANNNIRAALTQAEPAGGALPPIPDLPSPFLQSYIGGLDRLNANTINPTLEYLTGREEVYPPELLQRLIYSVLK